MYSKFITIIFFVIISYSSFSQDGGKNTYDFLELPNAARVAALGGNSIAINDDDLNLVFHNPSLLNENMSDKLVLNYINYMSDINFGYISYAKKFEKYGTFAAGLHYINYGKFIEADETGIITGEFSAAEYALNIMYAKPIDSNFTVGANIKPLYSEMDTYFSSGIAADIGLTYHTSKDFSAAIVIKNLGTQIKPYYKGNYEPLPFDIQLGVSKKLKHAPIRICFIFQDLVNYNLDYESNIKEEENLLEEDSIKTESKISKYADEAGRHIIVAAEIIPTDNFYIRLGYNYKRRKEMMVSTRSKLVGFSAGIGLKISKFHFSYGYASYHLAGGAHHFSISTNISDFYKKANTQSES